MNPAPGSKHPNSSVQLGSHHLSPGAVSEEAPLRSFLGIVNMSGMWELWKTSLSSCPTGSTPQDQEFQHSIAAWRKQNASFLLTYVFWHFHCASHEMERSHSEVTVFAVTLETHQYTHTFISVHSYGFFSPPSFIPSVSSWPQSSPPHMLVVQNETVIMEIRAQNSRFPFSTGVLVVCGCDSSSPCSHTSP